METKEISIPKIQRTIWVKKDNERVIQIIDQRHLPHRLVIEDLQTSDEVARAISEMRVRGAPLIGVTAAFGLYLAALEAPSASFDSYLKEAAAKLKATRPTAVNLEWALNRVLKAVSLEQSKDEKIKIAFETAHQIAEEDIETCRKIGEHGAKVIRELSEKKKGKPVNILTHCNAGWLACVEWGTATSAIYQAFDQGISLHIWVDETRPRSQGASLTAWEMSERKIPHTVITDTMAGHLIQRGKVDLVIVGTDRTTRSGDVGNKIGTYQVALAAKDNHIPFYVALPSSSIDWNLKDGLSGIPIEERSSDEVAYVQGLCDGEIKKVRVIPASSKVANFAFDVTPSRLITALITERGISAASEEGLLTLFPEKKANR